MYTYLREQTIAMKYKFTLYLNCTKIKLIFDIDTDSIYIYILLSYSVLHIRVYSNPGQHKTTQARDGFALAGKIIRNCLKCDSVVNTILSMLS